VGEFYVYVHKRADDGRVFYVGKGSGRRAFKASGRKDHWRNIVRKHGKTVQLVETGLTEEAAFSMEIELIAFLREHEVGLCNITIGGDGPSGTVISEAQRAKLRAANLGAKRSLSMRRAMSLARRRSAIQPRAKRVSCLETGELFPSSSAAARTMRKRGRTKATGPYISSAAAGKFPTAYGYTWRYA
jgi:hypothetical protein